MRMCSLLSDTYLPPLLAITWGSGQHFVLLLPVSCKLVLPVSVSAVELLAFGLIAVVSPSKVQCKSLVMEECICTPTFE